MLILYVLLLDYRIIRDDSVLLGLCRIIQIIILLLVLLHIINII